MVFSFFFLGTGAGSGGSGGRIFKRGSSGGECRFDRVTFTPGSGGGGRSTPTARLLSGTGTLSSRYFSGRIGGGLTGRIREDDEFGTPPGPIGIRFFPESDEDDGGPGRGIEERVCPLILGGGERGPGRDRDSEVERERGLRCFGEQTEQDSSEQLLTELFERERLGFGGGDGGRFERGKIIPRFPDCKESGDRRLLPGDEGLRRRLSIGDLGDRGDFRPSPLLTRRPGPPIGGSGGDLGRLRNSGERGGLLPSGERGRRISGDIRRISGGEGRRRSGGEDGGVLRFARGRLWLRDRLR